MCIRDRYLELIRYGREKMPEIVFTSDVIVGFPGETEAEFEDTLRLIETVRFDALFTFIYSPRPGTPAAKMPDPFPRADKNRRFDRLLAVSYTHLDVYKRQGYDYIITPRKSTRHHSGNEARL